MKFMIRYPVRSEIMVNNNIVGQVLLIIYEIWCHIKMGDKIENKISKLLCIPGIINNN